MKLVWHNAVLAFLFTPNGFRKGQKRRKFQNIMTWKRHETFQGERLKTARYRFELKGRQRNNLPLFHSATKSFRFRAFTLKNFMPFSLRAVSKIVSIWCQLRKPFSVNRGWIRHDFVPFSCNWDLRRWLVLQQNTKLHRKKIRRKYIFLPSRWNVNEPQPN